MKARQGLTSLRCEKLCQFWGSPWDLTNPSNQQPFSYLFVSIPFGPGKDHQSHPGVEFCSPPEPSQFCHWKSEFSTQKETKSSSFTTNFQQRIVSFGEVTGGWQPIPWNWRIPIFLTHSEWLKYRTWSTNLITTIDQGLRGSCRQPLKRDILIAWKKPSPPGFLFLTPAN